MEAPPIVLYQYGPNKNWGNIPSFDPHCLKIQAFLKFMKVPFTENNCNNPRISPTHTLPLLAVNNDTIVISNNIISMINSMGYHHLDNQFSQGECLSEIKTFSYMVENTLYNYQLYNWWIEEENFQTCKEAYFDKSKYPFPMNYISPWQHRKKIRSRLSNIDLTDKEKIYQSANEIYKTLSVKLGDKPFFFGNHPSSFDAIAFGFLASQYYASFKENKLHELISNYSNLVRYINNVYKDYFESKTEVNYEPSILWKNKKDEMDAKQLKVLSNDERRNNYFYALCIGLITVYLNSGFSFFEKKDHVSIDIADEDYNYIEEFDDEDYEDYEDYDYEDYEDHEDFEDENDYDDYNLDENFEENETYE